MKLASLPAGRDGRLVVVSDDLAWAVDAADAAPTLQTALDDWHACLPGLEALAREVERVGPHRRPFDAALAAAPLPRAYQWADGSAYVNHVDLVRRARGAVLPPSFWTDPLIYQGGSDRFLGPEEAIPLADPAWGCDFEAELCVVVGDVAQGCTQAQALAAIRLVGIVNDVTLRALVPAELAKGFGFYQSKPASALGPVLATPAALGTAWHDGRVTGTMEVDLNGAPFGRARTEVDLTFDFLALIMHAARTRDLAAGTIIGSGTISNRDAGGSAGRPSHAGGLGYSCIAEQRMVETIERGAPETRWLTHGDEVAIAFRDDLGRRPLGRIRQRVAPVA